MLSIFAGTRHVSGLPQVKLLNAQEDKILCGHERYTNWKIVNLISWLWLFINS